MLVVVVEILYASGILQELLRHWIVLFIIKSKLFKATYLFQIFFLKEACIIIFIKTSICVCILIKNVRFLTPIFILFLFS